MAHRRLVPHWATITRAPARRLAEPLALDPAHQRALERLFLRVREGAPTLCGEVMALSTETSLKRLHALWEKGLLTYEYVPGCARDGLLGWRVALTAPAFGALTRARAGLAAEPQLQEPVAERSESPPLAPVPRAAPEGDRDRSEEAP
jgi:hypothetical protein